ncbi:COP9 signalosome (CSN) subunit [Diaporthe australafricana]|uniref:COP9 signalosome (CSN) subunit n=1 Tax=Diaporthe australafricana TaxID=127596 RepID=A0ABR3Y1V8_9PEZI
MDFIFQDFSTATAEGNGYQLAQTLSPELPAETLKIIWKSTNHSDAKSYIRRNLKNGSSPLKFSNQEIDAWTDVYLSYWTAVGAVLAVQGDIIAPGRSSWTSVYQAWKELTLHLKRGYQEFGFDAWTIPCLYTAGKYLRVFAIKADDERGANAADSGAAALGDDFDPEMEAHQTLEECARQLNGLFSLCLTDRAPIQESRKWAIYYIINLLFKTYFKLNKARLSRTILKNLHAYQGNMPQLDQFPKSQQVTFKYYEGVLFFLEENYMEALLEPYPRLQRLFLPLAQCIKRGDLYAFDQALKEGEDEFVKRRIYLPLERAHDTCLRNLLRKVFIAGRMAAEADPPTRRTRIPTGEFTAAISLSSKQQIDSDEVECLLANMIYKGLMKGYIARQQQFVVLSKKNDAFPGTGV